jgi:NAD-dependent dihydropyrimidine dehydrogenase PreA subunit
MGHSGHLKAHHEALAERLNRGLIGFPKPEAGEARRGWQEILEILFDEEEARLAVHLPLLPAPLHDIAKRAHQSPEVTKALLDRMADKGLVMDLIHPKTGKTRYLLAPPVIGFFEFSLMRARDSIPKKELSLALSAYCHQDSAFAREAFRGDTVLGRAMVEESRLSPDLLPDVLPWERASELIADAQSLAVSLCYCRHKAQHAGTACDAPQDVCLSMNGGADFVIRRSFGRAIDRGEALAILQQCKEKELVQIADNVMEQPTYLCNCCGCCCGQLSAINEFGLDAVNKSGFIPEIDAHHCNGCGKCARACPIGAIDMKPIRQVGDRKNQLLATVSQDRCIGCGVCSRSCPER